MLEKIRHYGKYLADSCIFFPVSYCAYSSIYGVALLPHFLLAFSLLSRNEAFTGYIHPAPAIQQKYVEIQVRKCVYSETSRERTLDTFNTDV